MLLCAVVTIPLTILGAIISKNKSGPFHQPSSNAQSPAGIYSLLVLLMAGISGSFVWLDAIKLHVGRDVGNLQQRVGQNILQVYDMAAIVLCILMIVTRFRTTSAIYFQLVVDTYRCPCEMGGYGASIGLYLLTNS